MEQNACSRITEILSAVIAVLTMEKSLLIEQGCGSTLHIVRLMEMPFTLLDVII